MTDKPTFDKTIYQGYCPFIVAVFKHSTWAEEEGEGEDYQAKAGRWKRDMCGWPFIKINNIIYSSGKRTEQAAWLSSQRRRMEGDETKDNHRVQTLDEEFSS